MEEEESKEYRWETGYEKTWEAIRDDEGGRIEEASVNEIIEKEKRKRQELKTGNRRLGLMRHVYLIIDCSEAMLDQDLSPNRQLCTVKLLEGFIDEFFEQNPIAQMGVIITRNKRAEKLSDLAGVSKRQKEIIKSIGDLACTGQPSLQNALELAGKSLKLRPTHASREVIAIIANLTTCDPGNVADTIRFMKEENIRCSVIGLAAEVYVYKTLTKETKGTYSVILDDVHFKNQLFQQIDPPAMTSNLSASLIKMGFPHHSLHDDKSSLGLCMCHLDDSEVKLKSDGYKCPQCAAKYCELPVECKVCSLTLVSAPHLARTFHHLFPVQSFERFDGKNAEGYCFGCQKKFSEGDTYLYKCNKCEQRFCGVCDIFVHDSLRTCPGCATNPLLFQNKTAASFNAIT
ncbi:TFIIH basal transcription factor complex p44 subunit, putative [Pediculus humanus corporis]|uniref:General transcription factor IIH subunit n=1 Tax=Pediculus humanus subsp. corporis TaxID=121224 RepID=E0VFY0_PEDHC|nr:TFIIH basal transcription factor complex p44 subunit, putative [Pediculus humanus corporis]EEB12286.1 TFIIH basal transcription factor complex p44 subunit, putative [Pediculus humanus corporis]